MAPKVAGFDLSLTSTGVSDGKWMEVIRPKTARGHARIDLILRALGPLAYRGTAMVAVEGPSYGSASLGGHEEMAWLRGTVQRALWLDRVPFMVVPPASLKLYATGNGRADKAAVLAAAENQLGLTIAGPVKDSRYDMADAYWLARMALHVAESVAVSVHGREGEALQGCDYTYAQV